MKIGRIIMISFLFLGCNMMSDSKFFTHPGDQSHHSDLIRDCPEQYIDVSTYGPGAKSRPYYIYKGKRREVNEFDTQWISVNCNVKETRAY